MTVAYVTHADPHDIHVWSGTTYSIARALERQGVGVHYVGPLRTRWELVSKAKQAFARYVRRRQIYRPFEPELTRAWGRIVARQIEAVRPDVVLCPGTPAVADLDTDRPIVVYSDAVFSQVIGYGSYFSGLTGASIRNGHRQQRAALGRAAAAVYSSAWGAEGAVRDYGVDPARVHVVPFGANLPVLPDPAEVSRAIAARDMRTCRLLLLGVDWERKGGDRAVEVTRLLNEAGLPTTLSVAGCAPEAPGALPPYVRLLGFVSKQTAEGQAQLARLLAEAHFFILPSLADATPIVLNEAAAYGLPVLTHRVCGIPSIVRDGVNGWMFPPEAPPEAIRDRVLALMRDPDAYVRLARSSREEYERNLNWDVAGARLRRILEGVVTAHSAAP